MIEGSRRLPVHAASRPPWWPTPRLSEHCRLETLAWRERATPPSLARTRYASRQRSRCRRAMNRLASAQVTSRRCAFFTNPR